MSSDNQTYDFAEFLQTQSPLRSSISSQASNISSWGPENSPKTSPPSSLQLVSRKSSSDTAKSIELVGQVSLSFCRGNKLFKLRYGKIDVYKDTAGALRCIELSNPTALSGIFIHSFASAQKPTPHLEQPGTASQKAVCVSFLEDQVVQLAQTVFTTQPRYIFERESDCDRFQEAVLGVAVIFAAGVAEIASKGRGEEAISQNLRVCRHSNGNLSLLFFANCQRKEKKRYLTVLFDHIDSFEAPKKSSKPVLLKLSGGNDLTTSMRSLSILFLEANHAARFCLLLQSVGIKR